MFSALRVSARSLARAPGFTAAAILTLAIGVGGNVAIFSIVDRVVLRDLPFPESRRLVRIHDAVSAPSGLYRGNVLARRWEALREVRSFDRMTAQRAESLSWVGSDTNVAVDAASISPGTLGLLGISPILGRPFSPEEERVGVSSGVVLISSQFWRTRLGGDASAVGKPVRFVDGLRTVVGILPEGFRFPYHADVWLPLAVRPGDRQDSLTIARLAPNVSLDAARRETTDLAARLEREDSASRARHFDVSLLKTDLLRDEERVPLALMAAVGFLLLLGCANLSALLLSRSVSRRREMAIRAALGATRGRQIRQLLAETTMLSLPGGALGLLLALAVRGRLLALVPRVLGEELAYRVSDLDFGLIAFALALSLVAGGLLGIVPAWRASHEDPAEALASQGRATSLGRGGRRTLAAFVVGEIALATVLLAGAALMISDLVRSQRRSLGLAPEGLLSIQVPLTGIEDAGNARSRAVSSLVSTATAIPGIRSVAASTINPFWGGTWGIGVAPDGPIDPTADLPSVNLRMTTPNLFRAWQTPLLAGRDFSERDREGTPPVAIVSRRLARRLWPGEAAVGHRLVRRTREGLMLRMEVVGVVEDVLDAGELLESVYLPFDQLANQAGIEEVYLMVRGPSASGAWIRNAARSVGRADPRLAVAEAETMDVLYGRTLAQARLGTSLLSAFAAFGLVLATIGIFGVVAFFAGQRRLEMAIRAALGARPAEIGRLVLREGAVLGGTGSLVGLGLASALNPLLSSALHDFRPSPFLAVGVASALFVVTVAAASLPAARAARTNPNETLRGI